MNHNQRIGIISFTVGSGLSIVPILLGYLGADASIALLLLYVGPGPLIVFLSGSMAVTYGVARVRHEIPNPLTPSNTMFVPILSALLLYVRSITVTLPFRDSPPPRGNAEPVVELLLSGLPGQAIGAAVLAVTGVAVARRQWGWTIGTVALSVVIALVANPDHPLGSLLLVGAVGAFLFTIGWSLHRPVNRGDTLSS